MAFESEYKGIGKCQSLFFASSALLPKNLFTAP